MAILDFLFGRTKAVPTTTQVQSRSTLPSEVAPFATEVLEEAQQLYGERRGEGYQEFPGETIAPRTQQELDAIAGLRGLVGTQEPYRAEEEARIRATPTAFTSQQAETFMNPYQQSVIDVAKRKAQEDFEQRVMPQFEAKAIEAGGMSGLGTRAAVQAAELGRGFSEQLSDIQTIGQQKAFEDAYSRFGDQINRERTKAGDISGLGQERFNIGLAEQGLSQQLAQDDRSEAQAILADQFAEFTEREQFPEQSLAQYSSFVYGNPFLRQVDKGTTTKGQLQPTTSTAQQLLGLGLTGLQTAGRGGAFGSGFKLDNLFNKRGGGSVGGGLDSLPLIRRRLNGQVYNPGRGGAVSARTNREAQEAILRARVFKQLGIQGTTDETTIQDIVKKANLSKTLQRQSQATAREGLTTRNLKKLSVGTDKTFDPDFGRAAKAVIGASPTQGLVGLLGLAGAEAFEGQDIKVKERDKLKRDVAKIESNLTAADLAARQAGETSGTAEASAENIRAAEAASKLARDKITEGTKAKDSSRKVVGEQVATEKNMMDTYAAYMKAEKAGIEGGMKAADYNAILASVARANGAVLQKDEFGNISIMVGDKPLEGELLEKINAARDQAVNAWIDAGGGDAGFKAVTKTFKKGNYRIINGQLVLAEQE